MKKYYVIRDLFSGKYMVTYSQSIVDKYAPKILEYTIKQINLATYKNLKQCQKKSSKLSILK